MHKTSLWNPWIFPAPTLIAVTSRLRLNEMIISDIYIPWTLEDQFHCPLTKLARLSFFFCFFFFFYWSLYRHSVVNNKRQHWSVEILIQNNRRRQSMSYAMELDASKSVIYEIMHKNYLLGSRSNWLKINWGHVLRGAYLCTCSKKIKASVQPPSFSLSLSLSLSLPLVLTKNKTA